MLVSTQHQKGLEQKIFCKQMLVKFVIYISPCQYAEFMAAQTVQSGKAYYKQIQRRDLEMVPSESITLTDAKRYYRRARHNWLPSALILNTIIYHCKPFISSQEAIENFVFPDEIETK